MDEIEIEIEEGLEGAPEIEGFQIDQFLYEVEGEEEEEEFDHPFFHSPSTSPTSQDPPYVIHSFTHLSTLNYSNTLQLINYKQFYYAVIMVLALAHPMNSLSIQVSPLCIHILVVRN